MMNLYVMGRMIRYSIANIQTIIDINKVLEHKKYQKMNHSHFSNFYK